MQLCGQHVASRHQAGRPHSLQRSSRTCYNLRFQHQIPASTASSSSSGSATVVPSPEGDKLLQFVRSRGAIVHPGLAISLKTPSGPRGMIAAKPIATGTVLFQLPVTLRVTTAAAKEALLQAVADTQSASSSAMEVLEEEDDVAVLGLWLARERAKGQASPWAPYISALPPKVSCGWAKSPQELAADWEQHLFRMGLDLEWWQCFVGQAQQETRANAARLAAALGTALAPPGAEKPLSAEDVLWGLGTAMSRKFLVEGQMFLEPLSDMLNLQASEHPRCVQWTYAHAAVGKATSASALAAAGDGTGSPETVVSRAMLRAGSPDLAAGEEIYTSHGFDDMTIQGRLTPLTAYLVHGYVPEDMLSVVRMSGVKMVLLPFEEGGSGDIDAEDIADQVLEPQPSSPKDVPATQLFDYLTPQYQQDVVEVLDAVVMALLAAEQAGGPRASASRPPQMGLLLGLLHEVPAPRGSQPVSELIAELDAAMLGTIEYLEAMGAL